MRLIPVLACLAFCLALPGPTADARFIDVLDEMEDPTATVLTPDDVIDLSKHGSPGDVVLSADGKQIIYTEPTEVVDGWAAVVYYWPELLLLGAGLFFCWRLWATVRRRGRIPAERGPYCRKCVYPTQGSTGETCPECGSQLAGRGTTIGVTRRRTCLAAVVLLAFGGLGMGPYFLFELPRAGSANHWVAWRSEPMAQWVQTKRVGQFMPMLRNATAVRSITLDQSEPPVTLGLVPYTGKYDPTGATIIPNTPPPISEEALNTNEPQTYAVLTTPQYFGRIHLGKVEMDRAGRLDRDAKAYANDRLSPDAAFRYRYDWSTNAWYRSLIDGGEREQVAIERVSEIKLPIRTRSAGGTRAFQDAEFTVHVDRIGTEVLHSVDRKFLTVPLLLGTHQSGYLAVISSQAVTLYDVASGQWFARLDLSPTISGLTSDGLRVSISADRRAAAVKELGGKQVLIYNLPEPPKPDK